ncbi:hypothetical protein [Streptomyces sp. R41]|uniref:Uncharacterized protein n=1 Tax=Streptomyces sp. R41 TaxID=3238632 RepID=A0AB39RT51_9ACTN
MDRLVTARPPAGRRDDGRGVAVDRFATARPLAGRCGGFGVAVARFVTA